MASKADLQNDDDSDDGAMYTPTQCIKWFLRFMPKKDRLVCEYILAESDVVTFFHHMGCRFMWQLDIISTLVGGEVPKDDAFSFMKIKASDLPTMEKHFIHRIPVINPCKPLGEYVYYMTTVHLTKWLATLYTVQAETVRAAVNALSANLAMGYLAKGCVAAQENEARLEENAYIVSYAKLCLEWQVSEKNEPSPHHDSDVDDSSTDDDDYYKERL
jgi:hypothetical protein